MVSETSTVATNIIDRVEGESAHNHDIQLICGVMKGDVVAVMGDIVMVRDDIIAVIGDIIAVRGDLVDVTSYFVVERGYPIVVKGDHVSTHLRHATKA